MREKEKMLIRKGLSLYLIAFVCVFALCLLVAPSKEAKADVHPLTSIGEIEWDNKATQIDGKYRVKGKLRNETEYNYYYEAWNSYNIIVDPFHVIPTDGGINTFNICVKDGETYITVIQLNCNLDLSNTPLGTYEATLSIPDDLSNSEYYLYQWHNGSKTVTYSWVDPIFKENDGKLAVLRREEYQAEPEIKEVEYGLRAVNLISENYDENVYFSCASMAAFQINGSDKTYSVFNSSTNFYGLSIDYLALGNTTNSTEIRCSSENETLKDLLELEGRAANLSRDWSYKLVLHLKDSNNNPYTISNVLDGVTDDKFWPADLPTLNGLINDPDHRIVVGEYAYSLNVYRCPDSVPENAQETSIEALIDGIDPCQKVRFEINRDNDITNSMTDPTVESIAYYEVTQLSNGSNSYSITMQFMTGFSQRDIGNVGPESVTIKINAPAPPPDNPQNTGPSDTPAPAPKPTPEPKKAEVIKEQPKTATEEKKEDTVKFEDAKVQSRILIVEDNKVPEPVVESEGGKVAFDATNAKGIRITKDMTEDIKGIIDDNANGKGTAQFQFEKFTMTLDKTAIDTVNEVAQEKETGIIIVADNKENKELTAEQQKAYNEIKAEILFEAYVEADGEKIHDFNGGEVEVSFGMSVPEGKQLEHYFVYYIDENGKTTKHQTWVENGKLCFSSSHLSDYCVVYDEKNTNGRKPIRLKVKKGEKYDLSAILPERDNYKYEVKRVWKCSVNSKGVLKAKKKTGKNHHVKMFVTTPDGFSQEIRVFITSKKKAL